MKHRTTKSGFTLVELGLALSFIAMLLLIISALIISIIAIYRKGLSINSVSTTGRALIDDFSASITEAGSATPESICGTFYVVSEDANSAYQKCIADHAMRLILQEYSTTGSLYRGGVFCTGSYSYIWNAGNTLKIENHNPNTDGMPIKIQYYDVSGSPVEFSPGGADRTQQPRLVKVRDSGRYACRDNLSDDYDLKSPSPDTITANSSTAPLTEPPVDLIATTDNTLALYHLTLAKPNTNPATGNAFISGSFVLATITGGVNIMGTGNYCKTPDDQQSNFDYCAINNFNFATQAIGG